MMGFLTPHRVRAFAGKEPETSCRARILDGRLRFEFMFVTPVVLIGSARDGWTDISGASEQFVEWSADQVVWRRREFIESTEELRADGTREVWCLAAAPLVGPGAVPVQFGRLGVHFHRRHRNWR